jgi:hypothetical protein
MVKSKSGKSVEAAKKSADDRSNAYNKTSSAYNKTTENNKGGSTSKTSHKNASKNNEIVRNSGKK